MAYRTRRPPPKTDINDDGILSDNELELQKIKNDQLKQRHQRRLAFAALYAMILFMLFLFTPLVPLERVQALSSITDVFFISCAGITGAYVGVSTYISRK
tara:strand:- start:114 stop:413 length:300 start_codon:yes stop_codon:yes gene_type:complete